jgi:hypothetical protein
MLVSQGEVRNRIDQVKLSFEGYSRQLNHLDLSPERKERLENDIRLLKEELTTLETLSQFGRIEPARDKIEASVRDRLAHLRSRLAADPALAPFTPEERDQSSGEIRALQWALGEDTLTIYTNELMKGHDPDPSRTDRAMPSILIHALEEGPDVDTRASAAYDLGQLHISEGIPALAAALSDDPFIAGIALRSLASFTDEDLVAANLPDAIISKVATTRNEL